jgi:hypothetical protein
MEKMENILFTIITSVIFLGVVALGIVCCVNDETSLLIEKVLSITIISVLGGGFDLALNLYWWGVI